MTVEQIINFVQWNAQLSSAGQPNRHELAQLSKAGFTVVINLAMPDTHRAPVREDFIVTDQGIEYVHIPVVWTRPTYRDLMHFFAVMDLYAGETILVHCIMNMRATAFIYLYLTLCQGLSETQASDKMAKVWQPNDVWQTFIGTSIKRYKEEEQNG